MQRSRRAAIPVAILLATVVMAGSQVCQAQSVLHPTLRLMKFSSLPPGYGRPDQREAYRARCEGRTYYEGTSSAEWCWTSYNELLRQPYPPPPGAPGGYPKPPPAKPGKG
jgi:hypothetical protein